MPPAATGARTSPRAGRAGLPPVVLVVVVAVLAAAGLAACGGGAGKSSTAGSGPGAGRPTGTTPSTAPGASTTVTAPPSTSGSAPTGSGREAVPAFSHLFVVVMENEERPSVLAVPTIAALAKRYASADAWYAVSHPSLPNYLAMVSGSTWGVTSDCTTCDQTGPDLGAQLSAAGITWGAYMENMPGPCFTGPQSPDGLYAEKHDPFVYFAGVRDVAGVCAHVQPLTSLTPLLSSTAAARDVPRFVWVTPNLCDDGHNCSAATSGTWLAGFVATVTASPAWTDGGALVVTWDEGATDDGIDPATGTLSSTGGGGNVLTLVIAPHVPAGLVVHTRFDHYSLLRTIEDAFGLPLLGAAADGSTAPMSAFWSGAAGGGGP
jgi:phospholipase C